MKQITLDTVDFKKLRDMYTAAQRTPVIAMSMTDGLNGNDWATRAWNEIREFMDELGRKYGYKPQTARISMDMPTFEAEEA